MRYNNEGPIVIDAPIDVLVSDLPLDIRSRIQGQSLRCTYKYFRSVWTAGDSYKGDLAAGSRYRAAHNIANPTQGIRQ